MLRSLTLKTYVIIWISSVAAACAVLAATWLASGYRIHNMTVRIFKDAAALDVGRRVESAFLESRRFDLLWRETNNNSYLARRDQYLAQLRNEIPEMQQYAESSSEQNAYDMIQQNEHALSEELKPRPGSANLDAIQDTIHKIESGITQYLQINQTDMEHTVQRAHDVEMSVDRASIIAIIAIVGMLMIGSILLVVRLIYPVRRLITASREFGAGNTAVRVRVARDDELGELCQTFNDMADDVESIEKQRLEFVAKLAHDMRNQLVAVGCAARLLRRGTASAEQCNQCLDRITSEILLLEHVTANLMDAVQVTTGQLRLHPSEFDLVELVDRIKTEREQLTSTHSFVLESGGPCRIIADKHLAERAIVNLLSNAVKYSPSKTPITMLVEGHNGNAVFSITDQGVGMSNEEITAALRAFSRVERSAAIAAGKGLGLSIVREIVEAHGGALNIRSEPGKGTTFEIVLPAAPN